MIECSVHSPFHHGVLEVLVRFKEVYPHREIEQKLPGLRTDVLQLGDKLAKPTAAGAVVRLQGPGRCPIKYIIVEGVTGL